MLHYSTSIIKGRTPLQSYFFDSIHFNLVGCCSCLRLFLASFCSLPLKRKTKCRRIKNCAARLSTAWTRVPRSYWPSTTMRHNTKHTEAARVICTGDETNRMPTRWLLSLKMILRRDSQNLGPLADSRLCNPTSTKLSMEPTRIASVRILSKPSIA
jgi:hypothetical protein